jgi:2'-5' RNA ligase
MGRSFLLYVYVASYLADATKGYVIMNFTTANFTGKYGIVLVPNSETGLQAALLSKRIGPNLLELGGKHHAHLTLYHADYEDLPEEVVDQTLEAIAAQMPTKVHFYRIKTYANKFVFWDARPAGPLFSLHKQALGLTGYLKENAGAVGTEDLKDLSVQELDNIRRYGHPLVNEQWRPHITVGYRNEGKEIDEPRQFDAWFSKVAFARIGEYGTAQEFVKTLKANS